MKCRGCPDENNNRSARCKLGGSDSLNIITTIVIYYLFLFSRLCIYLIVVFMCVCVCMSVFVRELIQYQFR